ncbi:Immunoglobulin superfamily member 1 [Lonchura striata]|nr:Immunoglobulin superfamily member 1 [Lonchura striata domestica]
MLPVTCVLALGAPTISIFQKPPGVIPPGGSITICCICQCSYGSFVMYKNGDQVPALEQSGSMAEFSISSATYEDRGSYNCHYLEGGTVVARSTELEVFVEELRLPRPSLSVLPGHKVAPGADVMFRCTTTYPSTGCYLYLEGQIRAQLLPREQEDYNLSLVQEGDSGHYSCQCYTFNASREWSAASNTLHLVVRVTTLAMQRLVPNHEQCTELSHHAYKQASGPEGRARLEEGSQAVALLSFPLCIKELSWRMRSEEPKWQSHTPLLAPSSNNLIVPTGPDVPLWQRVP